MTHTKFNYPRSLTNRIRTRLKKSISREGWEACTTGNNHWKYSKNMILVCSKFLLGALIETSQSSASKFQEISTYFLCSINFIIRSELANNYWGLNTSRLILGSTTWQILITICISSRSKKVKHWNNYSMRLLRDYKITNIFSNSGQRKFYMLWRIWLIDRLTLLQKISLWKIFISVIWESKSIWKKSNLAISETTIWLTISK